MFDIFIKKTLLIPNNFSHKINIYLLIIYFIERVHKPRHSIPLRLFIKVSKKNDDKQTYKTNSKILELNRNNNNKKPPKIWRIFC